MTSTASIPRPVILLVFVAAACGVPHAGFGAGAPRDGGVGEDAPGALDAAAPDAADPIDAGRSDAGPSDAGPSDAGPSDAGPSDGGAPDGGCRRGTRRCEGDALLECVAGAWSPVEVCAAGCATVGMTPRCLQIVPANVTEVGLLSASTEAFVVPAGHVYVFDTDTGSIVDKTAGTTVREGVSGSNAGVEFRAESQGGAWPDLGVFAFGTLTVEAAATLFGQGRAALVLLASGPVRIDGVVDVGATGRTAGPGGGHGGERRNAGNGPGGGGGGRLAGGFDGQHSGGGGGGHAAPGGRGGDGDSAGGGDSGPTIADEGGTPLVGGGGGGAGADADNGGAGGGGGGALQITSGTSIVVSASGLVRAPGAGGRHGGRGGGGGGAGGTLLLEAPAVTLEGVAAANGGGGASGDYTSLGDDSEDGEAGRDDRTRARGGRRGGGGDGGDGGAGSEPTGGEGGDDGALIPPGPAGGGGGGAAGRVHLRTLPGRLTVAGTTSPDATSDGLTTR